MEADYLDLVRADVLGNLLDKEGAGTLGQAVGRAVRGQCPHVSSNGGHINQVLNP